MWGAIRKAAKTASMENGGFIFASHTPSRSRNELVSSWEPRFHHLKHLRLRRRLPHMLSVQRQGLGVSSNADRDGDARKGRPGQSVQQTPGPSQQIHGLLSFT